MKMYCKIYCNQRESRGVSYHKDRNTYTLINAPLFEHDFNFLLYELIESTLERVYCTSSSIYSIYIYIHLFCQLHSSANILVVSQIALSFCTQLVCIKITGYSLTRGFCFIDYNQLADDKAES